MKSVKPETLRRMKWAWSFVFCIFAFPCVKVCITFPYAAPGSIALLILVSTLLACFPLLGPLNQLKQARRARERAKWRTEYQGAQESRLLSLNDFE
jgi:hypothetical protein